MMMMMMIMMMMDGNGNNDDDGNGNGDDDDACDYNADDDRNDVGCIDCDVNFFHGDDCYNVDDDISIIIMFMMIMI